jgi:hypothetical protein
MSICKHTLGSGPVGKLESSVVQFCREYLKKIDWKIERV